MAIFEVAIERKIDIKRGILAQIYVHGKHRECTPGLQTPRLIVIVTNSPPTSTNLHIPISLYIDNYLPS